MSEKLGNVRKSTGISHFLLFWVELTPPPRNLKKPLELQWFRGGAAARRNFPPKRWLLVPRGVFFGDFHEKTMISSLFPTFGERGTFPPPPTQNLAMVMLFQWFWGVQFHPNRGIMLFPVISQYFHYFSCFPWKDVKIPRKHQKVPTFCVWGGECPPESIENDSNYNGFRGGQREGAQGTRSWGI